MANLAESPISERFAIGSLSWVFVTMLSLAVLPQEAQSEDGNALPGAELAGRGLDRELWISVRKDGRPGTGGAGDPLDGSTQPKFDAIMHALWKAQIKNITIHLGPGTFETLGAYVYVAHDPAPGWRMDDGWKLIGAGMGNTIIRLAGFTHLDPTRIEVAVADGVWSTKEDNWYQPKQEIQLCGGAGLVGLELGKTYYVSESLDSRRFKVSAALGGPAIAAAAVASGGALQRIDPNGANTVIQSNAWNKQDQEVRDLTIDCRWTDFGTATTAPFTAPDDLATVTVDVESTAWAHVNKWAYLQQLDYADIGAYEIVAVPNARQLVLRNLRHAALAGPARPGEPDLRFLDNAAKGRVVARGARVCPRINVSGVGLSGRRCKVERVHVTNVGCPIYEGPCGITMVGIGEPGPHWPQASELVIRDCVVDNIWGHYGWVIQIHGNNVDYPSRNYGTQAIVEGNTIYGNGLHQGLGGWNYVNSIWANNKVVNCQASFFTDSHHCWNNLVKNNLFLECKSYAMVLGGGVGLWKPDTRFKAGEGTLWNDVYYLCKADHAGHAPPDPGYWAEMPHQEHTCWNTYVFEGNLWEICDRSGPLLLNGNVYNTIFRNNIVRVAPGCTASNGLEFSNPTNRRLIVTGNVIDSRLKNHVGRSVAFGKDNVDERGRLRRELEVVGAARGSDTLAPAN